MATDVQAAVRDPSGTAKGIAAAAGSEDGVLFNACLCCYNAVDLSDVVLCFKGRGQYLCLTAEGCVDVNTRPVDKEDPSFPPPTVLDKSLPGDGDRVCCHGAFEKKIPRA